MYQEPGAYVNYAPGNTNKGDIPTMNTAYERPVNVLMGLKGVKLTVDDVAAIGAKRISVGSGLARCALGAFLRAARDIREHGSFAFADDAVDYRTINSMFASLLPHVKKYSK
jgi:2-methylisocitrate lyase-like PEP mutase family enzyme